MTRIMSAVRERYARVDRWLDSGTVPATLAAFLLAAVTVAGIACLFALVCQFGPR